MNNMNNIKIIDGEKIVVITIDFNTKLIDVLNTQNLLTDGIYVSELNKCVVDKYQSLNSSGIVNDDVLIRKEENEGEL